MGDDETTLLWRPTGPEELELVRQAGWRAWPPRLPGQPIFYPVLSEEYAVKIAQDWKVPTSGAGYVTRSRVRSQFTARYPVRQVGGQTILELWIPAEDLDELNASIVGLIEVVHEFHGRQPTGTDAGTGHPYGLPSRPNRSARRSPHAHPHQRLRSWQGPRR